MHSLWEPVGDPLITFQSRSGKPRCLSWSPPLVPAASSVEWKLNSLGNSGAAIPVATALATGLLTLPRRVTRRGRHRRSRVVRLGAESQIPTEYYGLFGLPLFTKDKKEIKAAHRRVVKLVHPDVLGDDAAPLQIIVSEAYSILSDEEKKADYDRKLRKGKPSLAQSMWGAELPADVRGCFVDETKCSRCYQCCDLASSTFDIHTKKEREEKAYVKTQYGDAVWLVYEAVKQCPTQAIRMVSRENMPLMEYAMTKSVIMKERARDNPLQNEEPPGPFEIMQELMWDELLDMDMDKAKEEVADPYADSEVSEELSDKAFTMYQAALIVPDDVRAKLWPDVGDVSAKGAQAMKQEKKKKTADADDEATASSMPGMHRAELKHAVFEMLDEDGDGRLYSPELRALAERFGFTGSDADWTREYSALCADLGCMPTDGPNLRMFSNMVDDEEACYLTDEEMVGMLNESLRLRRAGA